MAGIKIIAGDFIKSSGGSYTFGQMALTPKGAFWPKSYNVINDIEDIQLADEKSGVKVLGAAGWGAVGALVAGPAGLLVGGLLGGRGKKNVFVAKFKSGEKLMGEIDSDAWNKIIAKRMGM